MTSKGSIVYSPTLILPEPKPKRKASRSTKPKPEGETKSKGKATTKSKPKAKSKAQGETKPKGKNTKSKSSSTKNKPEGKAKKRKIDTPPAPAPVPLSEEDQGETINFDSVSQYGRDEQPDDYEHLHQWDLAATNTGKGNSDYQVNQDNQIRLQIEADCAERFERDEGGCQHRVDCAYNNPKTFEAIDLLCHLRVAEHKISGRDNIPPPPVPPASMSHNGSTDTTTDGRDGVADEQYQEAKLKWIDRVGRFTNHSIDFCRCIGCKGLFLPYPQNQRCHRVHCMLNPRYRDFKEW